MSSADRKMSFFQYNPGYTLSSVHLNRDIYVCNKYSRTLRSRDSSDQY